MTTPGTVERELLAALDQAGLRSARIDLPAIWPAVASWWRARAGDVADEDDHRKFYMALRPAAADPSGSTFAGDPPSAIAGMDLVCLEFERALVSRIDATATVNIASRQAALALEVAGDGLENLVVLANGSV